MTCRRGKKKAARFEYGSGRFPTPGYTTVDVCASADICLASPEAVFEPVCAVGVASEILSVHFIEHFVRMDVRRLVRMWGTMLKPGGLLITCFPDMAKLSGRVIDEWGGLGERPLFEHVFGAITTDLGQQELYRHRSFWTAEEYIELLLGEGCYEQIAEVPYCRQPHNSFWTSEIRAVRNILI